MGNKSNREQGAASRDNRQRPRPQQGGGSDGGSSRFTGFMSSNANAVRERLTNASKTGVCQVSKMKLDHIPSELMNMSGQIRSLDLSDNRIHIIPSTIGQFTNLKTINFSSNRIDNLPDEIGSVRKLDTLKMSKNRLSQLPDSIQNLTMLKVVNFSGNAFKEFPQQLIGMKNLDSVDLSSNQIISIPDSLDGRFNATELNLNQNQICEISESLVKCPRLKVLRLEENCLPLSAFTAVILKQAHFSTLNVDGNVFAMKDFHQLPGYDEYIERYTATQKKLIP